MFTQAINVVQLPTIDMLSQTFENEAAIAMGFGQYSNNPASTEVLRFIERS